MNRQNEVQRPNSNSKNSGTCKPVNSNQGYLKKNLENYSLTFFSSEIGEEEKSVIKKPNENEEKDMKEEEEKEEEEEKGEENEEKEEKIEENVDLVEQSSVQSSLLSSRVSPDRR